MPILPDDDDPAFAAFLATLSPEEEAAFYADLVERSDPDDDEEPETYWFSNVRTGY